MSFNATCLWIEGPNKGQQFDQEVPDYNFEEVEQVKNDPMYPFSEGSTWTKGDGSGRYKVLTLH